MKLGEHEVNMLKFVIKFSGLHSIAGDRTTQNTARSLERKKFIRAYRYGGKNIQQIKLDRTGY